MKRVESDNNILKSFSLILIVRAILSFWHLNNGLQTYHISTTWLISTTLEKTKARFTEIKWNNLLTKTLESKFKRKDRQFIKQKRKRRSNGKYWVLNYPIE